VPGCGFEKLEEFWLLVKKSKVQTYWQHDLDLLTQMMELIWSLRLVMSSPFLQMVMQLLVCCDAWLVSPLVMQ
jgi:hypothetical protein